MMTIDRNTLAVTNPANITGDVCHSGRLAAIPFKILSGLQMHGTILHQCIGNSVQNQQTPQKSFQGVASTVK